MKRHTLAERIRDETCQRFMAWSEWDAAAGIPHYRGISVTMGREDCGIKIETLEITE